MELTVHHRFQPLSVEDSGKQHQFTWSEWNPDVKEGYFLVHAMYQSGEDMIPTMDGEAQRGSVLRLQFDEHGKTSPGNGVELEVYNEAWNAADYQRLVYKVLEMKTEGEKGNDLSDAQKAAVFSQMASLYNLMATQYGKRYAVALEDLDEHPSEREINQALENMVTDQSLRAVSDWFKDAALDLMRGREPDVSTLTLPPPSPEAELATYGWHHYIFAHPGAKQHIFSFRSLVPPQGELPPGKELTGDDLYPPHLEGEYVSGEHGAKVALYPVNELDPGNPDRPPPFGIITRLGPEAFKHQIDENTIPSLIHPVPAADIMDQLKERIERGLLTEKQALSSMIMTASLYRLVATRYNGEFGYDPAGEPMPPHFFDDPKDDHDAQEAKVYAFRHAHRREHIYDVRVHGNAMFLRPAHIRDAESLDNFVHDNDFERQANIVLGAAARMMKGERLEDIDLPRDTVTLQYVQDLSPESQIHKQK